MVEFLAWMAFGYAVTYVVMTIAVYIYISCNR